MQHEFNMSPGFALQILQCENKSCGLVIQAMRE